MPLPLSIIKSWLIFIKALLSVDKVSGSISIVLNDLYGIGIFIAGSPNR